MRTVMVLTGSRIRREAFRIDSVALTENSLQGQLEQDVKRTRELNRSIPLHDYSPALESAVSWLGERYLLAEPVAKKKVAQPFYTEPSSWHPDAWTTHRKVN